MPTFVVVTGELWGVKSFPLSKMKDARLEATNIRAASNGAIRWMEAQFPKGARIKRVILDVVRVE